MQWFGYGRCEQQDGVLCVILHSIYSVHLGILVQWDANLLYLDVDFCNGRQHGFCYRTALHFIIVLFSHFEAAMRIAFEVYFSAAMSLFGFGFRTLPWHRFSFAMHVVAAGWYAQGHGRHGCCYCSSHFVPAPGRIYRDASVHTLGNDFMRLTGAPQWVNFTIATIIIFNGSRFEQWNDFRYVILRCSFTFFRDAFMHTFGNVLMRLTGASQWVNFPFATFFVFAGLRFEQ